MRKQLFTGLLILLEMISTNVVSADEIRMKDIDTLSKKNKVIIINKNELSKYLHLNKKKPKTLHKSDNKKSVVRSSVKNKVSQKLIAKKISKKALLINKIKNKNLIESLSIYEKYMAKNGKSKIAEEMILKKAEKIKNLDFDFFKKDFLQCNVKRLSNIIKDLNNEYK